MWLIQKSDPIFVCMALDKTYRIVLSSSAWENDRYFVGGKNMKLHFKIQMVAWV